MDYKQRCVPIYVEIIASSTNPYVDLRDNPYVQNIQCIELLEWKITGVTADPSTTPAYTDDIFRLRFDNKSNTSGFTSQTHVRSDSLGRDIFDIDIVKPQVITVDGGATVVTPQELHQEYNVARPLSYFPMGNGSLGQFTVEVFTTAGIKPTYTNIYVWLLVWVDNLKV